MILMEKRIGNKENQLSIEKTKEDSNSRLEKLSTKFESTMNEDLVDRKRCLLCNSKENAKTAANQVTSQHSSCPRWSEKTRMKSSAIIGKNLAKSSTNASYY